MSVSTVARRRKTTTYGKISHKPIIAMGNTFAKAAEAERWNEEDKIWGWDDRAASTLVNNVEVRQHFTKTTSGVAHGKRRAIPTKVDEQQNPPVPPTRLDTDNSHFSDTTVSPDHTSRERASALMSEPRKKRRITPDAVIENSSIVYDDASLQRHIAAESQNDQNRSGTSANEGLDNTRSRSSLPPCEKPKKSRHGTPEEARDIMKARTSKKHDVLGPAPNNDSRVVADDLKAPSRARTLAKACSKPKLRSRKVQRGMGATSNVASFAMANQEQPTSLQYSTRGRSRATTTSTKDLEFPTTPPRPFKHAEGTTTPRQQELWDMLLVEDTSNHSPSAPHLQGLNLTKKTNKGIANLAAGHQTSRDSNGGAALKSRRSRIIDTLCSSDNQRNLLENPGDCSEISSSDSLSGSILSEASAGDGALHSESRIDAHSQDEVGYSHVHATSDASQLASALPGTGLKVTYARQRSYLTDNDLIEATMLGNPVASVPIHTRERDRKVLSAQHARPHTMLSLGVENRNSQDAPCEAMRSIHELREAGGNVRLLSELEAILDDMDEDQSVSSNLRRSGLLELVAKLLEPSNCRLFIDRGLESRLLAHVGSTTDIITTSLLAAVILQLIAHSTSALLLSQIRDARIQEFLVGLLDLNQDLASETKLRGCNISKYAQQEYKKLCTLLSESASWRAGKPSVLSCNLLALQCLEHLVRQTRESGVQSEVLSSYAIRRIVSTSVPPVYIPLLQRTTMSALQVELGISILELCAVISPSKSQECLWQGETLQRVVGLLPPLDFWQQDECRTWRALTLYVNLTNTSARLCAELSTVEVIKVTSNIIIANFEKLWSHPSMNQPPLLLDNLMLSLGVLVNLAESCDSVRHLIMDSAYDDRTYLNILLGLFTTMSKSAGEVYSEEETKMNVAYGYLSVLIGFLCVNKTVRARVSSRLQGGDIKLVVDAMEEFLRHHRQAGRRTPFGEVEPESKGSFVGRLQGLIDDLKG